MDELRIICASLPGNQLVAAECRSLFGCLPDAQGVARVPRLDQPVSGGEGVRASAYLRAAVRCFAEAPTLPALAAEIARANPPAEDFRVEFLPLAPLQPVSKRQAVLAAANSLAACPNLGAPQHRFLVVAQHDHFWFGELLTENAHTYKQHDDKPYRTSSSLPSRLARALVNLARPSAATLLDPMCGAGSILLEAEAVGLAAYGMDWNPKMVGFSHYNLRRFGYSPRLELGDALHCTRRADAIVTDLPYGAQLEKDAAGQQAVLAHLSGLAPLAIYLAEQDITVSLLAAGYRSVEIFRVRKHARLSRYVHVAL